MTNFIHLFSTSPFDNVNTISTVAEPLTPVESTLNDIDVGSFVTFEIVNVDETAVTPTIVLTPKLPTLNLYVISSSIPCGIIIMLVNHLCYE